MKKIIITTIAVTLGLSTTQAQVAIGQDEVTSASVSLEFKANEGRGLLLPWVDSETAVAGVVNGTMVYDASENKVKVKYASGWTDLSVESAGGSFTLPSQPASEKSSAKVTIGGDGTDTTAGILVLADTDKAMVLPKVEDTDDVINPAPGMMVYVENKQVLALFNGSDWTFWKARD